MALFALFSAIAVIYLLYLVVSYYRFVQKFPRGPTVLPFVGNFFQLSSHKLHEHFYELRQQFGSIFTVFVPIPIVVLSDYETVKEAFITKGEDFSGRPLQVLDEDFVFCENPGVINSNGESWKENRRHAISILRDFGMGKRVMEEKVQESVKEFLKYLSEIKDKSNVDMRWPIQLMVANIINEILFGFRYPYNECEPLMDYVEAFNKLIANLSSSLLRFAAITMPWIKSIPVLKYYTKDRFVQQMAALNGYIRNNVNTALSTYSEDGEAECFVHAYRQRMGSSHYLTDEQLMATCSDFFLAGQETTTTTLRWAVLLLAAHQDVQTKLREEVLRVVGKERLPSMQDKSNMIYTQASALELQRKANILQMNVTRRTIVDTEVMGVKIPKDTFVNGDIHQIMAHDPLFVDPEEFRPDRYINDDGRTLNKELVERTIPFSIGKRQCAGEGLARVELFLGLASIAQNYRILPVSDAPIDLTPLPYAILLPPPACVRLEPV